MEGHDMLIPNTFGSLIQHNSVARKWMEKLPDLIPYFCKRWDLTDPIPVGNMTYNYVLFAKQRGIDVVLKLSWDKESFLREFHALQVYGTSHTVPQLLSRCITRRALLMERVSSGMLLSSLFPHEEDEANNIFVNLLPKLHQCSFDSSVFQSVERVLSPLFEGTFSFFDLSEAESIKKITTFLLESTTKKVILHGDLHHDNIIASGDSWVAIDPQGFIGDPAYDTGPFMRNPIEKMDGVHVYKDLLLKRAYKLGNGLGFDPKRILGWSVVQAALAACWDAEDQGSPDRWLPVFRTLHTCYGEG